MTFNELEKLTDESDRATAIEMEATENAIATVRARAKRSQEELPEGGYEITECVECGEEIGEQRLAVAIKNDLCIDCATLQERRR